MAIDIPVNAGLNAGTMESSPCDDVTVPAIPAFSIATACPLNDTAVGVVFTQTLSAIGGTAPYYWSLLSGALPTGLTLSAGGVISGTPSVQGVFIFVLQVTGMLGGTITKSCQLTVTQVIVSTTCPLDSGIFTVAYDTILVAAGGTGPYIWSITSGALPNGLSLSSAGEITGIPTTIEVKTFTLHVVDSLGVPGSKSCQLTILSNCFDFTDDYNRADGGIGANYSTLVHGSGVSPVISINKYAASANHSSEVIAAPATNKTGYTELQFTDANSAAMIGPMALRHTGAGADKYYQIVYENFISFRYELRKVDGGGNTLLDSYSIALVTPVTMRIEWDVQISQTVLKGYINGVLRLNATISDGSQYLTGKPGVAISSTSGAAACKIDNLVIHSCP